MSAVGRLVLEGSDPEVGASLAYSRRARTETKSDRGSVAIDSVMRSEQDVAAWRRLVFDIAVKCVSRLLVEKRGERWRKPNLERSKLNPG
jgi:hypothetical protein